MKSRGQWEVERGKEVPRENKQGIKKAKLNKIIMFPLYVHILWKAAGRRDPFTGDVPFIPEVIPDRRRKEEVDD